MEEEGTRVYIIACSINKPVIIKRLAMECALKSAPIAWQLRNKDTL